MSRYDDKKTLLNENELYKEIFRDRGVSRIRHFGTPNMSHPKLEDIRNLKRVPYVWKSNDRLSNIAYEFYGDSSLWWIIAWYNQVPTEHHISEGQTIRIPLPLEEIRRILINSDSMASDNG